MTLSNTASSALEILENMGVKRPSVNINLHGVEPRDAATIVGHFPDWNWSSHGGAGLAEWVEASHDGMTLTIFLRTHQVERPSDAQLVLESAGVKA